MGDYNNAYKYMSQAIKILQKVLPANHPNLLTVQKNLKSIEEALSSQNP